MSRAVRKAVGTVGEVCGGSSVQDQLGSQEPTDAELGTVLAGPDVIPHLGISVRPLQRGVKLSVVRPSLFALNGPLAILNSTPRNSTLPSAAADFSVVGGVVSGCTAHQTAVSVVDDNGASSSEVFPTKRKQFWTTLAYSATDGARHP